MLISKRGKEGDPFNLSNYCQEANLVIAPKRGTAIMWYNHFLDSNGEWLGERDPYTLHGGCDVRRGNKWIANHWITVLISLTNTFQVYIAEENVKGL